MQKRMPYRSYRKFLGACFKSIRGNFQLSKELGSFTDGHCNHRKRQPRKFQNLPADSVLDLTGQFQVFGYFLTHCPNSLKEIFPMTECTVSS